MFWASHNILHQQSWEALQSHVCTTNTCVSAQNSLCLISGAPCVTEWLLPLPALSAVFWQKPTCANHSLPWLYFIFPTSVFLLIYSFMSLKDCYMVIVYIFGGVS